MLRVKIEMLPSGMEDRARTLETIYIVNVSKDGHVAAPLGDYEYFINRDPRTFKVPDGKLLRFQRDRGAMYLTLEILRKIFRRQKT